MKYFQKLIWEKIYLSPPNPDDFEIVTKWMNDMEITNLTEIMPETFWLYQWKARFDELVKWKYFQNYPFAIIKKRWDKFIWTIWLYDLDFIGQSAELHITIWEKDEHNKWYWTDAITTLLKFGFNTLNLYNINLWVKSFNDRAIACYKKCGFKEVWTKHHTQYYNWKRYDLIIMEILKPNREKNNNT